MKFKMINIFEVYVNHRDIKEIYDIVSESRLPSRIFPENLAPKKNIKISK